MNNKRITLESSEAQKVLQRLTFHFCEETGKRSAEDTNTILSALNVGIEAIEKQSTVKEMNEINIIKNFLYRMPKTYRKRTMNWVVVKHILLNRTSTAGRTSCIEKCRELRIDPYGYTLD